MKMSSRLSLFPVARPDLYELFEQQLAAFWHHHEVDLGQERQDYLKLNDGQRRFISHVLAFFAVADQLVIENLIENFMSDVTDPSARLCFAFQTGMEAIHAVTYNLLLDATVPDKVEKERLYSADETVPVVREKILWARKFMDKRRSFASRLLAFICLEGIHFSGSFAAVYYIGTLGLMPGLCFANKKIAADESMHASTGVAIYNALPADERLNRAQLIEIVDEAVEIETNFICEAIPCRLLGMNSDAMSQYVRFVADHWLHELQQPPFYCVSNPFDWMEKISLRCTENFFEARVSAYQLSTNRGEFGLSEDF